MKKYEYVKLTFCLESVPDMIYDPVSKQDYVDTEVYTKIH